jgi:sugar fermentation stimulation protein A
MYELLNLGTKVILKEVLKDSRKTSYDLIGVLHNGQIVSIDCRVPNKLVYKALLNREIKEFSEFNIIQPEHRYGHSRFDFLLLNNQKKCLLEVKSCTLVRDGVALFPDAPTERGRRHVKMLTEAKKEGYIASVLFIIQRTDAKVFTINYNTDPKFGKSLRNAFLKGVNVLAYGSEFVKNRITLKRKVKVDLDLGYNQD